MRTNTQTLAWEKNRLTHRKIAAKTANLQGIIWYRGHPGTHRASVGNISHAKDRDRLLIFSQENAIGIELTCTVQAPTSWLCNSKANFANQVSWLWSHKVKGCINISTNV